MSVLLPVLALFSLMYEMRKQPWDTGGVFLINSVLEAGFSDLTVSTSTDSRFEG